MKVLFKLIGPILKPVDDMSVFKCWGCRGLLGSDLQNELGGVCINNLDTTFTENDIILNMRESSSKRAAQDNVTNFLFESASKSIRLYNALRDTDARLIYFSTIDFNEDLYCDIKRWLEKLPSSFITKNKFKVVRLPGIVGSKLRKGPIYDVIQSKLYTDKNIDLNIIDTQEVCRFVRYLGKNWEEEPIAMNLTPSNSISLRNIWSIVHNDCRCENPFDNHKSTDSNFVQAKNTNFSNFELNSSEFYLKRFLKKYGKICNQ